MAKLVIGFLWLIAAFSLIVVATAIHSDESSYLLRLMYDRYYESRNRLEPALTGPNLHTPIKRLPVSDGNFHVYALPVGQGDAHVLQCPNGDVAIIDLGSSDKPNNGFWSTKEIRAFLYGHYSRIKNIVITHNHEDHYSLFSGVFLSRSGLKGLENIYISCTSARLESDLQNWINIIGASKKLRTFNGGQSCGLSKEKPCEPITLCPGNPDLKALVLSANAANCNNQNKNIDSIVIGIWYKTFTMQLNGDFEDYTTGENGPQKEMVGVYRSDLQVTVYKLAHHGADLLANKPVMRKAVKPKAVFVSSNPWFRNWGHPKCSITEYFINQPLGRLCKPEEENPSSKFYCGEHPIKGVTLPEKLQQEYSCGPTYLDQPKVNEYAIYSTMPSENMINLVHLVTDGKRWGFVNSFQIKLT